MLAHTQVNVCRRPTTGRNVQWHFFFSFCFFFFYPVLSSPGVKSSHHHRRRPPVGHYHPIHSFSIKTNSLARSLSSTCSLQSSSTENNYAIAYYHCQTLSDDHRVCLSLSLSLSHLVCLHLLWLRLACCSAKPQPYPSAPPLQT